MLNVRKSGNLVMEMIDFQLNDKFGRDMELHITEIVAAVKEKFPDKAILKLDALKALESTIFKRLGMRVKFTVDLHLAAIMPLYSNQHHIFLDKQFHGEVDIVDQVKFMDTVNYKKGTVDIEKAKLGGFFSDYEHSVYMNFTQLVNTFKMEAGEITAILLHELGHGFYACEYSDRYATTNQILTNLSKELAKDKTKRNPDYIYKELVKLNPETKKEMIDDVVKGDRVVPGPGVFKYAVETVTYQLENNKYDDTAFESLADNFAARFGYGSILVAALQKLNDVYPENYYKQLGFWMLVTMSVTTILACIGMLFIGAVGAGVWFGYIGLTLTWLLFSTAGEQGRDYTYDDLKFRYKRIRDQLVQQIKSKAFNVKDATQLVKQIEYMDTLIKTTGQYRSSLDFIMNYIRPSNFRAKKSIERQQLLEDLATNDLFIQSLKLQSLATL